MLGDNPEVLCGAPRLSSAPDPNACPSLFFDDGTREARCPGFVALECDAKWLSRRARIRTSSGHSSEAEDDLGEFLFFSFFDLLKAWNVLFRSLLIDSVAQILFDFSEVLFTCSEPFWVGLKAFK
jgi:hypothetical protein